MNGAKKGSANIMDPSAILAIPIVSIPANDSKKVVILPSPIMMSNGMNTIAATTMIRRPETMRTPKIPRRKDMIFFVANLKLIFKSSIIVEKLAFFIVFHT
jgi:hypothetical protein